MTRFFHRFFEAGVTPKTPVVILTTAVALLAGTAVGQTTLRCESALSSLSHEQMGRE